MKIAIISDTHDNLVNLNKALDWIMKQEIGLIIHCGDVTSKETLLEFVEKFKGKIHIVFGNIDADFWRDEDLSSYKNLIVHGESGELTIDDKKIAFCHRPEQAKELASLNKYDLVFYGHTHKPWEEKINNTLLVNPGTLGGMFQKATFAVYEPLTGRLELKIIERLE